MSNVLFFDLTNSWTTFSGSTTCDWRRTKSVSRSTIVTLIKFSRQLIVEKVRSGAAIDTGKVTKILKSSTERERCGWTLSSFYFCCQCWISACNCNGFSLTKLAKLFERQSARSLIFSLVRVTFSASSSDDDRSTSSISSENQLSKLIRKQI